MASSPEQMAQSMIDNLPAKTGKSLAEWIEVCRVSGLEKHGEIVKLLKTDHGVTHGYANLIAQKSRAEGQAPASGDELVDAQYSGPKADLRPIYEALCNAISGFGDNLEVSPKKTYVSLRRKKQFALIQPSTKTRVDVGINLKGVDPTGRLEASGSFNAMVSHRVRLSDAGDVDAELTGWLRDAFDRA